MESLKNLSVDKYLQQNITSNGGEKPAPHERAYWVNETCKALGKQLNGEPYDFKYILGVTRKWKVEKIRERYHYCQKQAGGEYPFGRIWFGIIKQEKAK